MTNVIMGREVREAEIIINGKTITPEQSAVVTIALLQLKKQYEHANMIGMNTINIRARIEILLDLIMETRQ